MRWGRDRNDLVRTKDEQPLEIKDHAHLRCSMRVIIEDQVSSQSDDLSSNQGADLCERGQ